MGPEGSFPFVSSSDANEIKGVLKVYLGINFGITRSIKEVCEKWKGVPVLLCDFVQSVKVDTELEGSILFGSEEDRGTMRRVGRGDKSISEVFIEEFAKCFKLFGRERVKASQGWFSAFLDFNLEVIGVMVSEHICLGLVKHIGKVSIFRW